MSKLLINGRPLTVFDPTSKAHRSYYATFQKTQSWASCPLRFFIDEGQDNLVSMLQSKLSAYYTQKEFNRND